MPHHAYVVLSNPVAGREDEYNDWYTNRHLADVVAVPGFISAQRFRLRDPAAEGAPVQRYLAIYTLDTDDPERAIAEAARVMRPGGRLVVIDFAPHDLEYLRADHAHLRLGFSHQAMSDWMKAAGLDVENVVDLPFSGAAGRSLTVTVWLGRDRRILMAAEEAETQYARNV